MMDWCRQSQVIVWTHSYADHHATKLNHYVFYHFNVVQLRLSPFAARLRNIIEASSRFNNQLHQLIDMHALTFILPCMCTAFSFILRKKQCHPAAACLFCRSFSSHLMATTRTLQSQGGWWITWTSWTARLFSLLYAKMSHYATTSLSPFMSTTIPTNTPGCWLWCSAMLTVTCRLWMLSQMGPSDPHYLPAEQMTLDNSVWIRIESPLPPFFCALQGWTFVFEICMSSLLKWWLPYSQTTELSMSQLPSAWASPASHPAQNPQVLGQRLSAFWNIWSWFAQHRELLSQPTSRVCGLYFCMTSLNASAVKCILQQCRCFVCVRQCSVFAEALQKKWQ